MDEVNTNTEAFGIETKYSIGVNVPLNRHIYSCDNDRYGNLLTR